MASIRKRLRRMRLLSNDASASATAPVEAPVTLQEPESPKKEKTPSTKKTAPRKASKQSVKKAD
jgi:hypothetical protein